MSAIDATWPPAEFAQSGPFRLRRGAGGGKRVSAASAGGAAASAGEISAAENAMKAWDQVPMFRLLEEDAALSADLAAKGYGVMDPTMLYAAPVAALTGEGGHVAAAYRAQLVPAVMREIWDGGGIGQSRRAVMARAAAPSIYLMSRTQDRPAGAAFVAVDGDVAMIHAIEVKDRYRRQGCARLLMEAGARFASENGAAWMTLAVTEANAAARALYERMGMTAVGRYYYRVAGEGQP